MKPGSKNGMVTFYLVPPKVSASEGTLSDKRRVFRNSTFTGVPKRRMVESLLILVKMRL